MLQTAGAPEGGLHGTVHLWFTFLHLQQNNGQLPAGQGETERPSPCCKCLFTWWVVRAGLLRPEELQGRAFKWWLALGCCPSRCFSCFYDPTGNLKGPESLKANIPFPRQSSSPTAPPLLVQTLEQLGFLPPLFQAAGNLGVVLAEWCGPWNHFQMGLAGQTSSRSLLRQPANHFKNKAALEENIPNWRKADAWRVNFHHTLGLR